MVNKPRIAFCFSGQARTLDQTYLFFQKNLFDAAKEQGFDYDIFCAVEDDEDVNKVKLLNPTKVEKIKSNEVEKIIENKYGKNWKNNIFKDYVMYFSVSKKKEDVIHNFMQQLYKVSSSFLLAKKDNHKYDILVKLRFDCIFLNKINFINIKTTISNGNILCNKGASLFSNKKILERLVLINDMFFFGNESSMYMLCDIFDNIRVSLKGGKPNIILSKIFYGIKSLSFYLNKLLYCNKEIKHCIFPIISVNYWESFFYRVYSPEICYYYYFINSGIKVVLDNFSRLLLRDKSVENYINFVSKNNYEI